MPVAAKPTKMQAVKALYESIGGVPSPIYLDEAPEGTGWPRAVMIDDGDVPDLSSFDEDQDGVPTWIKGDFRIQIEAENDSDAAEAAAILVMQGFQPEAIQITDNPEARVFRRRYRLSKSPGRSNAGQPLYLVELRYELQFGLNY